MAEIQRDRKLTNTLSNFTGSLLFRYFTRLNLVYNALRAWILTFKMTHCRLRVLLKINIVGIEINQNAKPLSIYELFNNTVHVELQILQNQ